MYDIKLGQGCGIKATMLTPAGGVCDLRRARYIAASLVLPSGATINCEDTAFNEVTNGVYVRLLGTRELTTIGQYGIVFNVKLEDKTMYSTPVVWFAEVKEDAPTGYHELTLSLSLTVVNFPDNVSYTGASPKISDKDTWLIYDDNLNAYVDTGIEVGYANLLSRYDGKFAEIVVPCIKATDEAIKAAIAANNAAKAANDAIATAGFPFFGPRSEFPDRGNTVRLYIDTSNERTYRWDEASAAYRCVGWGINDGDEVILTAQEEGETPTPEICIYILDGNADAETESAVIDGNTNE